MSGKYEVDAGFRTEIQRFILSVLDAIEVNFSSATIPGSFSARRTSFKFHFDALAPNFLDRSCRLNVIDWIFPEK